MSAVTVTGTAEVSCSFLTTATPPESYCVLKATSLTFTPPAPAGAKVHDYLIVKGTNDTVPGWTSGLTITSPDTGKCRTFMAGVNGFTLQVDTQSPSKQSCGLKEGGLVPSDFANHFKAKLPSAKYYPAGNALSSGAGAGLNVALTIDLTIQ